MKKNHLRRKSYVTCVQWRKLFNFKIQKSLKNELNFPDNFLIIGINKHIKNFVLNVKRKNVKSLKTIK